MNTVNPESVGMSSKRLARIDDVMENFVKDNQLPGIMTLVQRKGEIAQFGMYGMMDIEQARPMEEDAIFRIYSMTKPITSIALMMLVEEGKLSLSDKVAHYIPAFAKTKVYAGMAPWGMQLVQQETPMTVHHLLTHTSGLSYGWFFDHPAEEAYRQLLKNRSFPSREVLLADYVDMIANLPLLYQPGERWNYSVSTAIVGYLVEIISEMPLADFFSERIFKPLGMVDTGFDISPEKANRLAQIYGSEDLLNPFPIPPADVRGIGDVTKPTRVPLGDGGLVSTLADYLRFANCLLNGGQLDGFTLIAPRTLQWMTSDHLRPSMLPMKIGSDIVDARFGLGFSVVTEIGESQVATSKGEYGWSGAAQTFFAVAPQEDMILLFMSQLLPVASYPVINRFRNLVYQAILE